MRMSMISGPAELLARMGVLECVYGSIHKETSVLCIRSKSESIDSDHIFALPRTRQ